MQINNEISENLHANLKTKIKYKKCVYSVLF